MADRRKPTAAELEILHVLWSQGPSTVRQVAAATEREDSYTTVLKLLQIMAEKKLVRRDESSRTHVYEATASRAETQRQLVADLVDRAFDGSAASLVMHALSTNRASADEIAQIRKLLDERKGGRK